MGYAGRFSAHGFRSTASTALNSEALNFRHDWIEFQLAHKEPNKTRAAYNTAQYWDGRVRMMQTWGDVCDKWRAGQSPEPTDNVIPIHAAAA
jgi:integrase